VICGAQSFTQMEEFGKAKREWLSKFLDLSHGIPSHDTFNNVFARLDPVVFEPCLLSWIQSLSRVTNGQILPLDGKRKRSPVSGNGAAWSEQLNAKRPKLGRKQVPNPSLADAPRKKLRRPPPKNAANCERQPSVGTSAASRLDRRPSVP